MKVKICQKNLSGPPEKFGNRLQVFDIPDLIPDNIAYFLLFAERRLVSPKDIRLRNRPGRKEVS
jgi:hypothetical protein